MVSTSTKVPKHMDGWMDNYYCYHSSTWTIVGRQTPHLKVKVVHVRPTLADCVMDDSLPQKDAIHFALGWMKCVMDEEEDDE